MGDEAARAAIEAVWRLESTRLIAALVRIVRDVALAEDVAQDAIVAALAQWPATGIPDNPAAWLMTTAKRRAIDTFRSRARHDQAAAALARDLAETVDDDPGAGIDHVEDDVLRLMFICCHPALTSEMQTTLTLKLVAGLSAREIARAYLAPEATIAQRISRAKRTLAEAGAAIEEPSAPERAERLSTVLGVVYLLFNEGYAATEGEHWMRPALCEEAVRLGRILTALVPADPEVHGLSALMELQSSRLRARAGSDGEPILLDAQDRSRWDAARIRRGLAALARAHELAAAQDAEPGQYALQAAIAAEHARAASVDDTDWNRVALLYEQLGRLTGSPVVELNRAVALGRAQGPEAGLALLDQLEQLPSLRGYHLVPSVRGDLYERLGRGDDAAAEFDRAAAMTANASERALLQRRAIAARAQAGAAARPLGETI
ncbi:RNA polymerase sigma factor [Agromyces ramosus]|uniref:RNA polymerase sigma factor (Sigma-70 family) n=1 Tax=Agromyces ramosus TaxID=33879 RepID=A0ABU0R6Y7_9MICO|nr:sigma-70 family RNA polymerase sigma factor [Agromyces ramosus]MDQ0893852.1 RNA polymerase sigma factor (sigma-70 family) [Agromyces ramosus]